MKIVFATNNLNKLKEVQQLLPFFEIISLKDIGCFEDIPETANTLEGNAKLKVDFVKDNYGYNCFADDTGLEVDCLNGEPGVFSARYAGEPSNSENNMNKLLETLKYQKNRTAQFRTVIALNFESQKFIFEGICKGEILLEKRGSEGFGYDPIFEPLGIDKSFAEMTIEEKGMISHRGEAIQNLIKFLHTIRF